MANRAFERALIFSLSSREKSPILGISCTAALHTSRVRKGEDRAFACIKSRKAEKTCQLDIHPGTREEQEEALSAQLLELIAAFIKENPV